MKIKIYNKTYEVIREDEKYYFCKNTKFRKQNKNIVILQEKEKQNYKKKEK